MAEPPQPRKWVREHLAGLVTTIVGGVVAAIIVAFLVPALRGDGGDTSVGDGEPPAGQEAPAETDGGGTDSGGDTDATEPVPQE